MKEETKVKSNAAPARWGKTRIVVTGGIAGMVILGGALAVANMIKKRISDTRNADANQDVPESSSRDEGLPCLLPTPECIHDEIDHIGCHGEQNTTVRMPDSIQHFLDKQDIVSMEDEASVITNTSENHHVPIQEDEKVSSPPDQGIEDESSRVISTHMDSEIVDSPKEEDRSTNNGVIVEDAPRTTIADPDAVETPIQIDDFYPEPEMLETPIKENGLDEHDYYQVEPENLGAAGDVIKDEICVMVSQESSSVTCDCIKEETENEDGEDPSSPLKEETQSEEEMEDSPDSSTESNSEAIWPVESKEDELLLSQEEKLYKETSQNDVEEEAGFVTMTSDMGTGMERPSKVFSRVGWLLLVVGLMFLLFASDIPISYPHEPYNFQK